MARVPSGTESGLSATASERRAFEALCDQRAQRARVLASRFPESSQALDFYGAVAVFQKDGTPARLLELVEAKGPDLLRRLARELEPQECLEAEDAYASGADRTSPRSFFGRVLLQARVALEPSAGRQRRGGVGECPRCGHPPQVGLLVPEGDGTALRLSCSLCFGEWRHPSRLCPACRESSETELVHYHAPEIDHLEVRACESCRVYLNVVRRTKAPDAVPDVDEITAMPLDVWAVQNGYEKLVRNLVGI